VGKAKALRWISSSVAEIISANDPSCIEQAARLLREGELVAYPTDTVYGLGAVATDDAAVRRLFAVKSRPLSKPMPLLIADEGEASALAETTPEARVLMAEFWPGALTIVMRKNADFNSVALAGQDKVALRLPDERVVREIVRVLRAPITGTSANRAGARAPRSASEVAFALGDMVALVIDGGASPGGQESTVIDITATPFTVVREGAVSNAELRNKLGKELV